MHDSYVADPAEPPPRPRLARWGPTIATLVVALLIAAATTLFWVGRGEEDPSLQAPAGQTDADARTDEG